MVIAAAGTVAATLLLGAAPPAAAVILDRLTADTGDLQAAGQITEDGLSTITTDINSLESKFFIPTDPC